MNISMPQSHSGPPLISHSTDSDSKNASKPAPRSRPREQTLDFALRSGLAGGVAGCAAKTLIAPLDRVKILFQTSSPNFQKYTGSWFGFGNAVRNIYHQDGFLGLFRGHSMTLVRVFPYAAIKFIAYEQYRAILITSQDHETAIRRALSGGLAGVTSVFFTYPLELTRVRLAYETKKNYKTSITTIFRQIYNEQPPTRNTHTNFQSSSTAYNLARTAVTTASDASAATINSLPAAASSGLSGFANFYRGFIPTVLGMIPYAGGSFLAHDMMGDLLRSPQFAKYCVKPNTAKSLSETEGVPYNRSQKSKLNTPAQLVAGAVAGLVGQTASYPLEIIRRRMQVGGAVGDGRTWGMLETAALIFREKGFRGFYVGLSIGFVKVAPMMA
ncbi:Mitoferrin [Arthrobotrys entomopaga]|nr:Mitoferrin [Arthrobotrys entomopaga]